MVFALVYLTHVLVLTATGAEVVDLLVSMAVAAVKSSRRDVCDLPFHMYIYVYIVNLA